MLKSVWLVCKRYGLPRDMRLWISRQAVTFARREQYHDLVAGCKIWDWRYNLSPAYHRTILLELEQTTATWDFDGDTQYAQDLRLVATPCCSRECVYGKHLFWGYR